MIEQDKDQIIKYLIHDKEHQSKITDTLIHANGQCECIKLVMNRERVEREPHQTTLYVDPQFTITKEDLVNLQQQEGQVIIAKRLCRLYPQKHQPQLFPHPHKRTKIYVDLDVPNFIYQLSMFEPDRFKRVILNNKLSQTGHYQILINRNGRYQLESIDDFIPVFAKTQEPLWSQYLNEPWKLILAKAWAKVNKGYSNLNNTNSFQFLQTFFEVNWKYFNLTTHGKYFLSFYKSKVNAEGKILLKAKRSEKVIQAGLIPGKICYELQAIEADKDDNLILIIHTSFENCWTGKQSILDKQVLLTDKVLQTFKLSHTIMVNTRDFLNLFSFAYVTHAKVPLPVFRFFHQFENQANSTKAKYFQITFNKEGFFNFSINQPEKNMVSISNKQEASLLSSSRLSSGKIFLALKYLLSRKISKHSQIILEDLRDSSPIGSMIHESRTKFNEKYNEINYDVHQVDHKTGYSKGAHFVRVIPGTYVLRVKAETTQALSNFTISYATHEITDLEEVSMPKQQSMDFLCHNIISFSDRFPNQSNSKQKYEHYTMQDLTDTFGYAFVVLKVNKKCPYIVIMEVNPEVLMQEGYVLKSPYKKEKTKFELQISSGQSKAIVFKRIKDRKTYTWPSKAFKVYIDKK